ncbi:DNA polymerase III subunit gamma/tau [Microaceticoccus formicicus]|uniref:DNA polymerase III subunit gamma/tau n=1 Tax=Microaceticoccus formicicus TaxID=3118105 RepID=UPI003CD00FB9|nr:DNA polymerase III subunit gamma/tau [Peptoniphilaceae bacterium AMB_02]
MYQAIYRKYRPKTFDEVISQSEIVGVLKNQVMNKQLGHAYIFSGTRGTGKTSCAKILARAVNCLNPKDGNPCNECANCKSILNETTMDVVEMDAASNRRIDDIRDLRDKVIYPPALLKYKVYIIDEAHMITNEGFNALLKIMEEPPSHLIFILATTELEKVPQTILSRCQRFDFNRIDRAGISKSIKLITEDLNIKIDDEAIEMIARSADGAMRDAHSILDQVLASSEDHISSDLVSSIIGTVKSDTVFELVENIINENEIESLSTLELIFDSGIDSGEFISSLLEHYRNLLLSKTVPGRLTGYDDESINKYSQQSKKIELSRIVDSIEIILDASSQMRKSELTKIISQITIVKLIEQVDRKNLLSRIEKLEKEISELKKGGRITYVSSDAGENKPTVPSKSENKATLTELKKELIEQETKTEAKTEPKPETIKEAKTDSDSKAETKPTEPSAVEKPEAIVIPELKEDGEKPETKAEALNPTSEELETVIEGWNSFVSTVTKANPFWEFWINDLKPIDVSKNKLTLYLPKDQTIAYKKAESLKDELKEGLNKYYNKNYEIIITTESNLEDKSEEEIDETFQLIVDLFGKDNVEKI